MKNELKIFENPEFGRMRTVTIENEVWFVGKDVATVLGYKNTKDALASHIDDEDRRIIQRSEIATIENHIPKDALPITFVSGDIPNRGLTIINESGLYSLILGSKLPKAKEFKHWVTSEVLPALRKTGSYSLRPMTQYQEASLSLQKAKLMLKLAEQYEGTYRQVLHAHATKEMTGEFLLPLPVLGRQTYSAKEVGDILGISANQVGRLANKHNLKDDTHGQWFKDKSPHSNKEVSTFRYYGDTINELRRFLCTGGALPPEGLD